MAYLAHTAHWQFFALVLAVIGLILTIATSGVDDWRVWYVDDLSAASAGTAWMGVWRACFYSHVLDEAKFCRSMWMTDSFLPPEIVAAQVLCLVAIVVGFAANLVGGYAVRRTYFNVGAGRVTPVFVSAAVLYFLAAVCLLVPVFWNVNSVLQNRTIDFPPEFFLPPAPYRQELGLGIVMGIGSSVMILISGLLFLLYRQPQEDQKHKTEADVSENPAYTQEEL
ncbi:claudin-34 [Trichomycterus rosablanca]|uniref:claudin-34 n=1 Tax=Trichomycterus rosablanca TaxID=2290929 RepID=UPI002F34F6EF